jgi:hypothetical protein
MRSTILRIALAAILAAAGIGCGVAVGSGGTSQGSALPRVLGQLDHGAEARAACETVEAATFLSGGETLPEAQVAALARERFSHRAEADRFAHDVALLRGDELARAASWVRCDARR